MMKLAWLSLLTVAAAASGLNSVAAETDLSGSITLSNNAGADTQKEDTEFWERFLGNYRKMKKQSDDMSMTPPPAPGPTPTPPTAPAPGPTPPPVPGEPKECLLEVTVDCKLPNGQPCDEKQPPSGQCSDGSVIYVAAFSYQYDCDCEKSKNKQLGEADCVDFESLENTPVTISCTDLFDNVLTTEPEVVGPYERFTVSGTEPDPLPPKINCTISSSTTGEMLQWNLIDVSGQVDLQLKDKFGALELESCNEQVCVENLCFSYDIANIGTEDMTVTTVTRTMDDEGPVELVEFVVPNPLAPGESATIEEKIDVDYCTPQTICNKVYAKGNNPAGDVCEDENEYKIYIEPPGPIAPTAPGPTTPTAPGPTTPTAPGPTTPTAPGPTVPTAPGPTTPTAPGPTVPTAPGSTTPTAPGPTVPTAPGPTPPPSEICTLEITASCDNCDFNTSTLPGCEERPTMFGMLFRGGNCDENNFTQPIEKVTCADFNGGPPKMGTNATSYIEYTGKDTTETPLFAGTVQEGDVFYLYNGGEKLDADLNFNIWSDSSKATLLQSVSFHASCSQPLVLKNVFGATQIVQFANSLQGNVSCFLTTEVMYTISVPVDLPAGEDSIIIRELTIRTNYTNPAFIDLTPMINGTLLSQDSPPLEVSFEATLNLAIPQAYETILTITAETVNSGQICRGADYSTFFAPINEAPPGWVPAVPTAPLPTAPTAPSAPSATIPTAPAAPSATIPTAPAAPSATIPTAPAAPTVPAPTPTIPTAPAAPAVPTAIVPTAPVAPTVQTLPTIIPSVPSAPSVAMPVSKKSPTALAPSTASMPDPKKSPTVMVPTATGALPTVPSAPSVAMPVSKKSPTALAPSTASMPDSEKSPTVMVPTATGALPTVPSAPSVAMPVSKKSPTAVSSPTTDSKKSPTDTGSSPTTMVPTAPVAPSVVTAPVANIAPVAVTPTAIMPIYVGVPTAPTNTETLPTVSAPAAAMPVSKKSPTTASSPTTDAKKSPTDTVSSPTAGSKKGSPTDTVSSSTAPTAGSKKG